MQTDKQPEQGFLRVNARGCRSHTAIESAVTLDRKPELSTKF